MRFLLDENVPFDLMDALAARGHVVDHVALSGAQATDRDVLARAVGEQAVLVTFDSDFGRLIFYERCPPPLGLIYMQARPGGVARTIGALLGVLDASGLEVEGHFVVIDEEAGLRVLPLT